MEYRLVKTTEHAEGGEVTQASRGLNAVPVSTPLPGPVSMRDHHRASYATITWIHDLILATKDPTLRPEELRLMPDRPGNPIASRYYSFLYVMASALKPRVYVELGVDFAVSLAHVKRGSPSTLCVGVDVKADCKFEMEKRGCFPGSEFWNTRGDLAAFEATKRGLEVDLLFVDSRHDAETLRGELDAWAPLMAPGSLILCDDVHADHFTLSRTWALVDWDKVDARCLHEADGNGFGIILTPNARPYPPILRR